MNGKLLVITAKYLAPVITAFSLYILFRGHNAPGGGFAGGLTVAVAFSLILMALGKERTRALIPFDARSLIGAGLLLALFSSLSSVIAGGEFLKGKWIEIDVCHGCPLYLGTPILFDVGVYLVVTGVLMIILFSLTED